MITKLIKNVAKQSKLIWIVLEMKQFIRHMKRLDVHHFMQSISTDFEVFLTLQVFLVLRARSFVGLMYFLVLVVVVLGVK